jgi:uroporphyrinogen decarboxylase
MKEYRELRDKSPSFRERSENPEISIEISLQPFRAFQPDGVILFSDILTPLPGIGIPFDIIEQRGSIIAPPLRSQEQIDKLYP